MKNERRHELETNYLADRLGVWVQQAKPYTSVALLGFAVLVLGVLASSYFSKQSAEQNEKNWEAYFRTSEKPAQDRDGFLKAAKTYADTSIEPWAAMAAADSALRQGCSLLWIDKKESTKHLNAANADYEAIVKSVDDELIKQRATYSLAVCQEALGRVSKAIETYRQVNGPLGKKAAERADELSSSDDLKGFYDWYAKAELPSFGPLPGARTPGEKPDFDIDSDPISPFLPVDEETPDDKPGDDVSDDDATGDADTTGAATDSDPATQTAPVDSTEGPAAVQAEEQASAEAATESEPAATDADAAVESGDPEANESDEPAAE